MLLVIDLPSEDRKLFFIFLLGILDFLCVILSKVIDFLIEVVVLKLSLLLILDEFINLFSILPLASIVSYLFLLMLFEHGMKLIYNFLIRFLPKKVKNKW